jgi:3-methyladenine DNA glycosylase AlkD
MPEEPPIKVPLTAEGILAELRRRPPRNTPAWRTLRRKWSAELAGQAPNRVIAIAQGLVSEGPWARLTAYELIAAHRGAVDALGITAIRRLARGLSDWPSVDTFGCYIAGPAWRVGVLGARCIRNWARSPDRWRRRLALVCTVALNVPARGGHGDTGKTLAICGLLIDDRDDMVVKAMSWALRALVRWDRAAVKQFAADHEARLAPRVIREVNTKLRTGRKNG